MSHQTDGTTKETRTMVTKELRAPRGRLRSWLIGGLALAASVSGLAVAGGAPAHAVEGDLSTDLVGWWKLD